MEETKEMSFDYNKITFGTLNEGVNTVIEIPKGSMLKVEWDRKQQFFVLDRVEPGIFAKPCNYGFIPQTLDEDGDELDTLVVTSEPIPMGVVLEKARVIGVVNFEDDSEMDHKVIVVPEDDRHYGKIEKWEELGEAWKKQIEHHFNHYKDLKKPGTTNVMGFADSAAAWKIIEECIERAKNEQ